MALRSQPFKQPFANLLGHLCAHPPQHALFLNMLSLLEHMGSRKIMLSQMRNPLTQDTLKHMAEETRHAYFFKRQAEKLAGRSFDGYRVENTLCPGAARMYFGRLDSLITAETASDGKPDAPYLWVSLIIELRACWTYRLYQMALQNAGSALSLKSILAEEDRHMEDMYESLQTADPRAEKRLKKLSAIECTLFGKFLGQLERTVMARERENAA